jgi:hypothetical protein
LAPSGTIANVQSSNTAVMSSTSAAPGAQSVPVPAIAAGTTTLTVTWTDSNGNAQSSQVFVTVAP